MICHANSVKFRFVGSQYYRYSHFLLAWLDSAGTHPNHILSWFDAQFIHASMFLFRIREVAEKINKYGPQSPQTLQSLKAPVKQIVIGPAHLGLLLEDGRALRVAFTVLTERLDLSKQEPSKG